MSLALIGALQLFMSHSFIGRAIQAVAQDPLALRLMAANPSRIKRIAFGLSIATASVAGAILIIIQPVEPSIARDYIGRIFAICVMGGLGSFTGTMVAAMILGVMESLTSTFYGPSWSPAVAFGFLLITLAVRPSGLFGRRLMRNGVFSVLRCWWRWRRSLSPGWSTMPMGSSPGMWCCNTSCWQRRGISWAAIPGM